VELSPGKQPDSRTADAAVMAMRIVRRTGISGWGPLTVGRFTYAREAEIQSIG
jgi:hypothetical protein